MGEPKQIPDELIDNIVKQNFKNIVDKARAGKTLSRTELAMVEELKARGQEIEGVHAHPKITKSNKTMVEIIQAEFGLSERKSYLWLEKLTRLKTSRGWQVSEVLDEIDKRKRSSGSSSTPEIMDLKKEKLQEEVFTLRAKRRLVEGELVDRRETEKEYRKHLSSIKQVITDWQAHETAKHPIHVDLIDNLAKRLIDRIAESCGE